MTKHTSGPWRYGTASNYCGFYVAPENCMPTLAAVERPAGSGRSTIVTVHNFPGETEANARLIAASPELFEACVEALERFNVDGCPLNEANAKAIEMLRDAILKATRADDSR